MPALDIPSSRLSSPESGSSRPSSYYECDSIDDVVNRIQTYNRSIRDMIVGSLGEIDDSTVINQGTSELRQPQLTFHSIHGTNVSLQKGGRLARRHESFCKGLAFSNRPIGLDENVCIKQCEVATNWSGVLRFGLTNIDPDTYRNTQVPKFACPDLSSKEGYWAKALPERYSVEGNILHFYVNAEGELYYGINGQQKGLFLMGINTTLPLWVIVDIYGNSTAVEFIDPSEHRTSRRPRATSSTVPPFIVPPRPRTPPSISTQPAHESHVNGDLAASSSPSITFHRVVGRHVTLSNGRTVAVRSEDEYSHGYVFTDRPVANNEKVTIQITRVLDLYTGGLAVGLTCQDPATLRGVELPADSSDLVNFPDMYVGIKDVANKPPVNTKMSFWVSDKAELKIQIDDRAPRTLIYVDNSLQLYFYFDVYGSTQAIKLIGSAPISRSRSPHSVMPSTSRLSETMMPTHVALPPRPTTMDRDSNDVSSMSRNFSASITLDSASGTTTVRPPLPARRGDRNVLDLLTGGIDNEDLPPMPPPLTPSGMSYRGASPALPSRPAPALPPASLRRAPAPPPVSSIPSLTPRFTPSIPPPTEAPPARPAPPSFAPLGSTASSPAPSMSSRPIGLSSAGSSDPNLEESEECTVCMAAPINSVIYTCGHMCMCYVCALQTKELGRGCPICRKPMQDVIRTFKT
ncbi:hypothetical protein PENTCL1PPCAC_28665 [Pristionchus entomophagus]|uniref:Protein neuralized n=1 Tax=Pristionchus entomophagus TaxID=358040 RepID=A0AAV5UHG0_9BILA|nr:hypothetical protein PENTCL1PPCAC_28665 [Pristionchus entomophagus]